MNDETLTRKLRLDSFLAYVMNNIAKKMSESCALSYFDEYGISIPEWRIMARLAEQAPLTLRVIGDMCLMDKTKVSRAVRILEEKSLLERLKHDGDSRSVQVALTPAGHELYAKIAQKALVWEDQVLQGVTAAEYKTFIDVLAAMESQVDGILQRDKSTY